MYVAFTPPPPIPPRVSPPPPPPQSILFLEQSHVEDWNQWIAHGVAATPPTPTPTHHGHLGQKYFRNQRGQDVVGYGRGGVGVAILTEGGLYKLILIET
jgi:hypothetical protein